MAVFNEDTRVKIPATIQFMRLGYAYQSLKDIDIHAEVRFVELLEAVPFALHLLRRLEDGEAVLRYEGFVFPRLVLLVAESGNRSSRHAKHQNGYGYSGKQDAIEIFSHA